MTVHVNTVSDPLDSAIVLGTCAGRSSSGSPLTCVLRHVIFASTRRRPHVCPVRTGPTSSDSSSSALCLREHSQSQSRTVTQLPWPPRLEHGGCGERSVRTGSAVLNTRMIAQIQVEVQCSCGRPFALVAPVDVVTRPHPEGMCPSAATIGCPV